MASRMAKSLRIVNRFDGVERRMFLEIDGEEFPYFTAAEGWNVAVSRAGLPGVTLTIVAESVQVDHSIERVPE